MSYWQQVGQNIVGDTAHLTVLYSGRATAISDNGSYIAISDKYTVSDFGRVKIFKNTNNTWTQIGQDIIGGWGDSLGSSLSFSSDGQIIALGAPNADGVGNGAKEGAVRVYKLNNDSWEQIGEDIQGKSQFQDTGNSVSLSADGKTLAIGVRFSHGLGANYTNIGAARIYRNNNDSWEQIGSDIYGEATWSNFGSSVSLSSDGSKVAVSNKHSDVRVFQNTNDNWSQIGSKIEGIRGSSLSHSSLSISSNGNRLVIGGESTPLNQFPTNTGSVRVFDFNGDWSQVGETLTGESEGDYFGNSVDISNDGSIIAIGAYGVGSIGDDSRGEGKGSIYVYEESNNNWTQLGDAINGEYSGDQFGKSVSLSGDGSTLIVGADFNDEGGLLSGNVRIFSSSSGGSGSGGSSNLTDLEAYNYIASHNDLISAFGIDIEAAKSHYTNYGKSEGRSLTSFSATDYLSKYSDLSAAFGSDQTLALKHYIEYGYEEGRTDTSSSSVSGSGGSSNLTDLEAYNYIASHNDLISAFGLDIEAAKSHYTNYGISEGRSLTSFSASDYLAKYSDLSAAFGSDQTLALKHYIEYGFSEGRTDTFSSSGSGSGSSSNLTDFEALNYIASYGDLINAFGTDITSAKSHYTDYGKSEGRTLDDFDEWGYLASNNNLINSLGSDTTEAIKHYISFGYSQGKITNSFDAQSYLNNYGDLKNAFGDNQELATKHYVEYGFNEGRVF